MNRLNFEYELEELNRKTTAWGKRSHNLLGRSHLLNIYIQPRLSYKLRHLDMPKDILTKYNKQVYNFLWECKTQTIAQAKISMPKYLGGTGHIDIVTRQKAIWLKQLDKIITNPNEEYNKLTRSTIGPNPKLNRIILENNNTIEAIAYSELTDKPKIKYLRNYIRQNEVIRGKTKDIYQQLKANEFEGSGDQIKYFKQLQLEKNPKLYQYGLLTGHMAHKTRHWLFNKNFNIPDVKESQGKCNTCNTIENSDHILNHCLDIQQLREHIKNKHNLTNLMTLTDNKEVNRDILIYQKTALIYKIHKNKGKKHTSTPMEQFENRKKLIND